jgi:hypothetical protein
MGNVLLIAAAEARLAAESETTLEGRVRAAMKATVNHWMAVDEDSRFKAAVAAAIELSAGDERDLLEREMRALAALSASMTGIPVNFDEIEFPENPIGLLGMWAQVKGSA